MNGAAISAGIFREHELSRLQGTILIVDDEERIRHLFLELLRPERVPVRVAGSGQEAIAMVKEMPPALLIVDVLLPDQDGIAVLEEAQKIDNRIIGVVMTGAATVELAVRAMKAGAIDFLIKPFQNEIMLSTVRRLLELHRLRAENTVLKHAAVQSGAVRLQSLPFQTFGDDETAGEDDGQSEYERGVADGQRRVEEERRQDLAVLIDAARKFDVAQSKLQRTFEDEVIALSIQIVSKILHEAAESSREQIVIQVKDALGAVGKSDTLVIQVHPLDAAAIESARTELTRQPDTALKLAIEPVASLPRGSCLVHTSTRLADASLDTQLLRLGDTLRNRAYRES
ncbi:MAG: response regulator [Nitrospira sp.]|nr:response regulator [Nitrospira sp.]MDH4242556.1 response regulator [Nitrospira sp.]MDH4355076.1 response regulator [Nitrospira sp.]MDH5317817.1 response regulator [Nitrospira sp.]